MITFPPVADELRYAVRHGLGLVATRDRAWAFSGREDPNTLEAIEIGLPLGRGLEVVGEAIETLIRHGL